MYSLVDNYGANKREEREGQAKIRSQVGDGEGQSEMVCELKKRRRLLFEIQ